MTEYTKRGYLLEDFRLFHLRDAQGTKVDYHYHEFCKLLFLVSGSGSYVIEGQRYLLSPGDVVLIGSHCVHRPEFERGVPYERIIIYVSPDFLLRQSAPDCDLEDCFSGKRGHVLRPNEQNRQALFSLATSLEQELSGDSFGRTILARGQLLRLLVEISRQLHQKDVSLPGPMLPVGGRMLDILHYLDAHATEAISIDALADQFYISKYHMMRQFRKETGNSIHAYLSNRRLMLARDMILHGASATDACFASGFHSYSSFSRAYTKLFGTTPTGRAERSAVMEETYE